MSEFCITPQPALATVRSLASGRVVLEPLPEGHVVHVLGKPGDEQLAARLEPFSDGSVHAVRTAGPGQWLIVGNSAISPAAFTALCEALKPEAFGLDQSHGRVRILLKGAMAEQVLSKGTAVDLAISAFPAGCSTSTLIGHITVHLTRIGENIFEIIVLRSFAESLWNGLAGMCAEYL